MRRSLPVVAALLCVSCGGDDSATPAVDASADVAAVGDSGPPVADAAMDAGSVAIGVADVTVYAGAKATLTAAVTGAAASSVTFSWAVTSAPAMSGVTTASIASASSASPSLVPDLVGDYVVTATATATGSAPVHATATLHATAASVLFARTVFSPSGGDVAVETAGHDGSNPHAVACAISFLAMDSTTYQSRTLFAAATAMDMWEAPAGQPSRYAFSGTATLVRDDAGDAPTFLIAGTTESSCNQAPTTLVSTPAPSGAFGQPRFSSDGSRLAYLVPMGASFGVATIGFDGSSARTLGPIYATAPSSGDESQFIRPAWQDATHVAWPRPTGSGTWSVVVASDTATPAPTTYMTCTGSTPHHIVMQSDGSVVTAYTPTSGAAANIFVLKPDASGACQVVHALTGLTGANSRAHDFDVSPDGSKVAYLHYDASQFGGAGATGNEGYLYVVPTDGSAAPSPVGATPVLGRIGPRWIAAGTRLAWTRAGVAADGGDAREADDVNVVLPDGGAPLDIVSGDGVDVVVGAVGPGGSCAVGWTGSGRTFGALALAFFALAMTRRRRARA
jgi:hypothetical protein